MAKCEWCDKRFDPEWDGNRFNEEYVVHPFTYSCFRPALCFSCACQAIEEEADGVYFDTCEECGTEFDLAEAKSNFASNFTWYSGTTLTDYWDQKNKILCADCALKCVN